MLFKNLRKKKVLPKEKVDTRTQIAPTVSVELKENIERLAYILDRSVQDLCILLYYDGVNNYEVISKISEHFQTGILLLNQTLFFGFTERKRVPATTIGETDRIHIRFDERDMKDVELTARLLDVANSHAVAVVLDASIRHRGIVENLIKTRNKRQSFDYITIDELQKLMAYINTRNPYKAEWNPHLLTIVNGPKRRPRMFVRKMTEEMIDRETYRWKFD